jgi:hypothetical protein
MQRNIENWVLFAIVFVRLRNLACGALDLSGLMMRSRKQGEVR